VKVSASGCRRCLTFPVSAAAASTCTPRARQAAEPAPGQDPAAEHPAPAAASARGTLRAKVLVDLPPPATVCSTAKRAVLVVADDRSRVSDGALGHQVAAADGDPRLSLARAGRRWAGRPSSMPTAIGGSGRAVGG
jgi:hypothetical protein